MEEAFLPQYTKSIRDRAKNCVKGYIRENYKMMDGIPVDVQLLCFLMYVELYMYDTWNLAFSNPELDFYPPADKIDNTIFKVSDYVQEPWNITDYPHRNAFGNITVKAGELQQWRIRILNKLNDINKLTNVIFGIINVKNVSLDMTVFNEINQRTENAAFWDTKYGGYGYCSSDGHRIGRIAFENGYCTQSLSYGGDWDYGDVITMTLDLTTNHTDGGKQFGLLSFAKNGVGQGIAFNDIPIVEGEEYCMAVSIYYHMNIELLGDPEEEEKQKEREMKESMIELMEEEKESMDDS